MTDLQQLVERVGPLDYRRVARYVVEVAEQLSSLHDQGHSHRAVLPSRLIIDDRGRAALIPGGPPSIESTALCYSDSEAADTSGLADYLAPEQALNSSSADSRSDVYSLGCEFYFLLTGRSPFPAELISETLLAHQVQRPPSLIDARPGMPAVLVTTCEKMMAKKPDERPTAPDTAAALRRWLEQQH